MQIIQEIVKDYIDGIKVEDIAVKYGFNEQGMRSFVTGLKKLRVITEQNESERKVNMIYHSRKSKENELRERDIEIVKMHSQNQDLNYLSSMFGISENVIKNVLISYGVYCGGDIRKNVDYPYNLLQVMFCENKIEVDNVVMDCFKYAINSLSEKRAEVIKYRYENQMTLGEIGKIYGVSRERVRQIEGRALREMRYKYKEYKSKIESNGQDTNVDVQGFTTRTYNALMRNGISDLKQLKSKEQLKRIRNLGNLGIQEILIKCLEKGIVIEN